MRQQNHHAIAGFLLPFCAAGLAVLAILAMGKGHSPMTFGILFLGVIPAILLGGFCLSLRSIPLIVHRDDKDYAYSGLVINMLFAFMYFLSLMYFFK